MERSVFRFQFADLGCLLFVRLFQVVESLLNFYVFNRLLGDLEDGFGCAQLD